MWPFATVRSQKWADCEDVGFPIAGLPSAVNQFGNGDDALISARFPPEVVELILEYLDGDRRGWRHVQPFGGFLTAHEVAREHYLECIEFEDFSQWLTIDSENALAVTGMTFEEYQRVNAFDKSWWCFNQPEFANFGLETLREEMEAQVVSHHEGLDTLGIFRTAPKWCEVEDMLARVGRDRFRAARNRFDFIDRLFQDVFNRRVLIFALKADLCLRIIQGGITMADAQNVSHEFSSFSSDGLRNEFLVRLLERQLKWVLTTVGVISEVVVKSVSFVALIKSALVESIDWELVLSIVLYAALMVAVVKLIVTVLTPVYRTTKMIGTKITRLVCGFTLAPTEMTVPMNDQILITDAKDGSVSIALAKPLPIRVEEMAMAGSALCASAYRPVGAIMVVFENSELRLVGCFFRYRNYMVTARHVANMVHSGVSEVYLVGVEKTSRGTVLLRTSKPYHVDRELFDLDQNEFTCESLDVFARKLGTSAWGAVGLQQVSTKKPSAHRLNVNSCGFVNGVMQTGCGTTLKSKGQALELGHTASTQSGFSGSPVFGGGSVVGMHVAGQPDHNVMVRVEAITHFLPQEESNNPKNAEYEEKYKHQGEPEEYYREHGVRVGVTANGRARFVSEEELARHGYDSTDRVLTTDFVSKTGRNWADYSDDDDDDYRIMRRRRENAIMPTRILDEKVSSLEEPKKTAAAPPVVQTIIKRCEDVSPVHCGKTPPENQEVVEYFAEREEEIATLGYVAGEQTYPDINMHTEKVSGIKHLELFEENVKKCVEPPTPVEIERTVNLLEGMMEENKYEPMKGYRSPENIMRIIDSNLVNERKSAGSPHQQMGMATNGDVLRKLGKTGVVELVEREWNAAIRLKMFLKAEAAKRKKLNRGMPRCVTGFPLEKMIKNQALFREMLEVAVAKWKESPVKYAFSPGNPGHCEHLAALFKGRKVVECDKSNWDYNMFDYFFVILEELVVRLAVQPADMDDEEFTQYIIDVRGAIREVAEGAQYVFTNGEVYEVTVPGIMKSGWLLTIFGNSVSQVALDILVKIRMGMTDAEILNAGNVNVAGGDDTLQSFTERVKLAEYKLKAAALGFEIEFKEHDKFLGSEFFSNVFKDCSGVIGFEPVRTTKHLEKLKRVKAADLPMALSSAMINYCWTEKHFNFFQRMYKHFRKINPTLYPLTLCKSRVYLRYKCKGLESVDDEEDVRFERLDDVLERLVDDQA